MVDGRWLRWLKIHGRAPVIDGMHGEEGNKINNNFIMNLTKDSIFRTVLEYSIFVAVQMRNEWSTGPVGSAVSLVFHKNSSRLLYYLPPLLFSKWCTCSCNHSILEMVYLGMCIRLNTHLTASGKPSAVGDRCNEWVSEWIQTPFAMEIVWT